MGDSGRLPIGQDVPVVDETFVALERELGLLLRRAHASSSALARRVHPDIEPSAYTLLALIAARPALRASDLAASIGVGRGTMSRQLARLGTMGLVSRRPDPDDYRGQLLELTEEGHRRLDEARDARREFVRRALAEWPAADVAELSDRLARLNADLVAELHRIAPTN
jgi:DNA-binding MarR family transcriptional regulator